LRAERPRAAAAPGASPLREDDPRCRVLFTRGAALVVRADPLPEQIADHLGHRVLRGEFRAGDRLKEIELAGFYRVSRGPIREAFRLLERRGLVEIVPRHGARVRMFDLGEIGNIFSIRAVLLGLAAREAVSRRAPDLIERLERHVRALARLARERDANPFEHATLSGEAQRTIYRRSGNPALAAMLEDLTGRAYWRMIWNEAPLDFTDRKRRAESARFWTALLKAAKAGNAAKAEGIARALIEASRQHTVAAVQAALAAAPPSPTLPLKGGGSTIESPPPLRGRARVGGVVPLATAAEG